MHCIILVNMPSVRSEQPVASLEESGQEQRRFITVRGFQFEIVPDRERPGMVVVYDRGDPTPYRFVTGPTGRPEPAGHYRMTKEKFAAMLYAAAGALRDSKRPLD